MAPTAKRRRVAAAEPESGGLAAVTAQLRVKTLEEENAELKEQIASLQAPTSRLKYTYESCNNFLKDLKKANAVDHLDLSELERTTNSYSGNWYLTWKPDKKLDNTVMTILTATDVVKSLDLGPAQWAAEDKYLQEFSRLLQKYKPHVTSVRVAVGALVNRPETVKSLNRKRKHRTEPTYSRTNIMNVVGAMPKLTTLKLIFDTEPENSGYAGEFDPKSKSKKLFGKVRELEVTLTDKWFSAHVGRCNVVGQPDPDPSRPYMHRSPRPDTALTDLLSCRRDVLTHLDMVAFEPTKTETAFYKLIAGLTSLRSIALRAEMLAVTKAMKHLEAVDLRVSAALVDGEAVQPLVELLSTCKPLQQLKKLEIKVDAARFDAKLSVLLTAVAAHCRRLESLTLDGSSWTAEALAALLQSGAPVRELHLNGCGALEPEHLAAVAAMPELRVVRLPSRLLGKPGWDAVADRGLDLRWQY